MKQLTEGLEESWRISEFVAFMGDRVPAKFMEWLIEKGFFVKPASIHHQGQNEGDLFMHSITVAQELLHLTEKLDLKWENPRSPYIVGMFHDLCKIDNYQKTEDEKWEYNNAPLLKGHGDKSVILLQQFIQLTDEEMLCIRWHMGAFDEKENWNSFGRSVTKYPNVLYTHVADMIAARIFGI